MTTSLRNPAQTIYLFLEHDLQTDVKRRLYT